MTAGFKKIIEDIVKVVKFCGAGKVIFVGQDLASLIVGEEGRVFL